jgi:2-polyprenyl-6-methoxyphenol hydroxylase-like FAD-dependent oxidoreductase
LVTSAKQPILQAIYDLESPRLAVGRVVLLGDAAFVARPHVAAGVTKAAFDARALADELADAGDDIEAALLRYDQSRSQIGRGVVARARYLGSSIGDKASGGIARSDRSPEQMMTELGSDGLVNGERIRLS